MCSKKRHLHQKVLCSPFSPKVPETAHAANVASAFRGNVVITFFIPVRRRGRENSLTKHHRFHKVFIFVTNIKFSTDLSMSISPSVCLHTAHGEHSPGCKHEATGIKFGRRIGITCMLVKIENGPNSMRTRP